MKNQEKEYIGTYKVVRIYRNSNRHEVLERGLTKEEAKKVVNCYSDSQKTIVVFMKQFSSSKYFK